MLENPLLDEKWIGADHRDRCQGLTPGDSRNKKDSQGCESLVPTSRAGE